MAGVFELTDNPLIDLHPDHPPPPLPLSTTFAETYLQHRTRPPFRLVPRAPYSLYDLLVYDNLPIPTTPQQVLDHLSLFPGFVTDGSFSGSIDGLDALIKRMVRSVTLGFKKNESLEFRQVAHTLHTLASFARFDSGTKLIVSALSPRGEKPAAVERAKNWAREIRSADVGKDLVILADCGISWRTLAEGLCVALMDALIGVSLPSRTKGRVELLPPGVENPGDIDASVHDILIQFPTLHIEVIKAALRECGDVPVTLDRLQEGWRPRVTIGYRGAGKRIRDVAKPAHKLQNFGGSTDVDWIKRRVAADAAWEVMEAEAEEEARIKAATEEEGHLRTTENETVNGADEVTLKDDFDKVGANDVYDVYEDEPDEGVLEGEMPLSGSAKAGEESDSGDEYDSRAGPEQNSGGWGRRGGSRGRGGDASKRVWRSGGPQRQVGSSSAQSVSTKFRPTDQESSAQNSNTESRGRGRPHGRPRGSGRGGGRGGHGRGRASTGPRSRRDRAAQKQSQGM